MAESIGYVRVSTREQNPEAQEAELRAAGCQRVFVDHGESSRIADRPQWTACLDYARRGDTITVRRLDRLAGSERLMIEVLHDLDERGLNIVSLTEPMIDTTTPMGRALYGIVAVFAQLRVDTIRENTLRGLEHARSQGRYGGRPTVMTPERIAEAQRMRAEHQSFAQIGRVLGVGASSVRRALSQPSGSSALHAAAKVPKFVDGFSGATPAEICERYAAGSIDRAQLVDELTRFPYVAEGKTDGYDSLIVDPPGTWSEVSTARRRGLIEDDVYSEVFNRCRELGL